jgi:hypothetical protein
MAFLNRIFDSTTPHERETAKVSKESPRAMPVIVTKSMM